MYEFNIRSPKTLEEALGLKATYGSDLHLLAGGTDVLVSIRNNRVDWGEKPFSIHRILCQPTQP